MKPIIALTDFSAISLNAVNYAADMASQTNSKLILLHICPLPMAFSEVPFPPENLDNLIKNADKELLKIKDSLNSRFTAKTDIETSVIVGSLVAETESYCQTNQPFAVVIGTQGATALERALFGSNTIGLIKHLSWPLIIVPPEAKFAAIRQIGLACDLENVNETVPAAEIRSFVKQFAASLLVLHVNPKTNDGYSAKTTVESRSLQNMLEDLKPVYHFLQDEDIEASLSKFATDHKLDLLITIPKKHNIFDQLVHKSHSKKLVLHTHLPIVSVHE